MPKIPLTRPYITQEVKQRVCDVLDSGFLTEGPVTHELEEQFRSYVGTTRAVALTSATTGLEVALRALGVGPGDEVIVPDYTYPATADVVAILGATTVIVDVSPDTMLVDYDALEAAIGERTKVLLPVSIFGNPLDYDRLGQIRARHNVKIVEDAACSVGAAFRGRKVGSLADLSVFSLHPRKFITTGEGGMITTDDAELAAWIDSYKHFGMQQASSRSAAQFVRVGTNYKLSDIQAAVGVVQMRHVDELLARRIELSERYTRLVAGLPEVRVSPTTPFGLHSRQSFCVHVPERDKVLNGLRDQGIEAQIGTYALHLQPAFQDPTRFRVAGKLEGSRFAFEHCLTLPLFHELTEQQQQEVVRALAELV